MKIKLFLLVIGIIGLYSSCTDVETEPILCPDLMCEEGCIFKEVNQYGKIRYISCFDTWAILVTGEDEVINVGLSPEISEEYKVEDKAVRFSATYFKNDLPLILPDPSPLGRVYRVELCGVTED